VAALVRGPLVVVHAFLGKLHLPPLHLRNPAEFLNDYLPGALRAAAGKLESFVGGVGTDYVFTENATAGCNTILNSIRFGQGDEILVTDHCYPAVLLAAQKAAGRAGATIIQAKVPFPLLDDAQIVAAVEARLTSRTRLVILDHITSPTALVFPVHELTTLCQSAGARVLTPLHPQRGRTVPAFPESGEIDFMLNM
jgi:isopenicillin-N epimerase